jgi:hypothetical protein
METTPARSEIIACTLAQPLLMTGGAHHCVINCGKFNQTKATNLGAIDDKY